MSSSHRRGGISTQRATASVLCRCSACQLYIVTDSFSGHLVNGRYVGRGELKTHRKRENDLRIDEELSSFEDMHITQPPQNPTTSTSVNLKSPQPSPRVPPKISPFQADLENLASIFDGLPYDLPYDMSMLVFSTPPTLLSPPAARITNSAIFALKQGLARNTVILADENWLLTSRTLVKGMARRGLPGILRLRATVLLQGMKERLHNIDVAIRHEWERRRCLAATAGSNLISTDDFLALPLVHIDSKTLAWYLLVAILHLLSGVSMDDCSFVLSVARTLESSELRGEGHTDFFVPHDIRYVIDVLNLKPRTTSFVCCPKCFYLYEIVMHDPESFPERCTNKDEPDGPHCDRTLRRRQQPALEMEMTEVILDNKEANRSPNITSLDGGGEDKNRKTWIPVREFLYNDVMCWLARLFCRPGFESYLDNENAMGDSLDPDEIWDIMDAPEIRQFEGPDGRPFIQNPGSEARIFLGLNEDGLNPLGNKTAGKSISTGAIYLVCLNLPAAIRFRMENLCLVGVIPGPREPTLHQMNYLLRPVVQDLKILFKEGIYLTKTPKHRNGRLVRAALVPLISDLPASRQVSGFAHFGHTHFCHMCKQTIQEIDNLDYKIWKPHTIEDHLHYARKWRDATTQAQRDLIYENHGVRWSELLELDYWNPLRFVVIDSMHAFYLGLFRRHCRKIWGMDVTRFDGVGISFKKNSDRPSDEGMQEAHLILRTGHLDELVELNSGTLRQLCRDSLLQFGGRARRGRFIKDLIRYRIKRGWFDEEGNLLSSLVANDSAVLGDTTSDPPFDTPANLLPSATPVEAPPNSSDQTDIPATLEKPKKKDLRRTMTVELADIVYAGGSKTDITRLRKEDLVTLANLKLSKESVPFNQMKAPVLREIIHNARIKAGILNEKGKIPKIANPGRKKSGMKKDYTVVLGHQVLKEIRADMALLKAPSWLSLAPKHPGEASWGKFTADQWRAFCSIHLPITLIRLWGSKEETSFEHRALVNFMHLVTAVEIATSRKVTPVRIKKYEAEMHKYLSTLLEMYPGTTISAYQHLSLHYGPFLRGFGPSQGWRCWPFERANYKLQQIPTNTRLGQLEKTMMSRFCMSQNLRALLSHEQVPSSLHTMIDDYECIYNGNIRGTLANDTLSVAFDESFKRQPETVTWTSRDMKNLPTEIYRLLTTWIGRNSPSPETNWTFNNRVFVRGKILWLGKVFRSRSASLGDSQIVFRNHIGSYPEYWSAGRIRRIFSHTRQSADINITQTFVLVQEYSSLSNNDVQHDHHRKFSLLGGRIFYEDFNDQPVLLPLEDILGHFGYTPMVIVGIARPCFHAKPFVKDYRGLPSLSI